MTTSMSLGPALKITSRTGVEALAGYSPSGSKPPKGSTPVVGFSSAVAPRPAWASALKVAGAGQKGAWITKPRSAVKVAKREESRTALRVLRASRSSCPFAASWSRFSPTWTTILALGLLLAWLASCRTMPPTLSTPLAPAATQTPLPAVVPTQAVTVSDVLTLTWWTPEFISQAAAQPSGALLASSLAEFEAEHQGKVRVQPILKARYGKGGLLDYLRTAQPVAPGILPDLVTLDITELEQAAALGLLQPLDDLLSPELVAGLYPFARQAGQFNNRLLAAPIVADIEHVAYNPTSVGTPPDTWADLVAAKTAYLFPVGSPQPPSAATPSEWVQPGLISQYLSAGGILDPATHQLSLQEAPLLRLLSFYSDAWAAGVVPPEAIEISNLDDAWAAYIQGNLALVNVSARHYAANPQGTFGSRAGNLPAGERSALSQEELLQSSGYTPLPGWSGPATPVASGWALAIVATDPARRQAAAALIDWLLAPGRIGPWVQAAGWLPTAPAALATWGTNPYYDFLDQQLAAAVSHPAGPDYPQVAARLQKAVLTVLQDHADPREAAQAALSPPK